MSSAKKKEIKTVMILGIFLALILLVISYAKKGEREKFDTWDIHFEDLTASTVGSAEYTMPKFSNTVLTDYTVTFTTPGDAATFRFKVVNDGNLPAKLTSIIKSIPRCKVTGSERLKSVCDNLVYKVIAEDGTELKEGDLLGPKTSKVVKVKVEYPTFNVVLPKGTIRVENLDIDLIYQK